MISSEITFENLNIALEKEMVNLVEMIKIAAQTSVSTFKIADN